MLEELRRYNTIGDLAGIIYFSQIVLFEKKVQKTSVQKLCGLQNNISLNIGAAIAYYKYADLIIEEDSYFCVTELGKELADSQDFAQDFCKICFERVIRDGLLDLDAVHYSKSSNTYYIEKFGFSVSAALFRNILIQYKALREDSCVLNISTEYESLFVSIQKKMRMKKSLEKLKEQLGQQEIQGEKAELFAVEFEKRRLSDSVKSDTIKRISAIDVSAGYDIVSYNSAVSLEYDRFIEVKSYQVNLHFYWSKNEIDIAKLFGNKYFLYLVDVTRLNDDGYEPEIICNPAADILVSEQWIMSPTSFLVMPTE